MVAFQRLVFIYQLGLASAGLAMSILSLTLLTTSPIMAIAPQPVLVGGLVLGLVLTFVAMLGALGAFDDQNTPALVGYGILMLAITGVTIWGITAIGSYLQDEHVETQLDRVWMQSDTNTVLQVESWGQCCGFHNYTDRIQEPCTKYSEEVGCFEVMKKPYVARLSSMMVPGTILLACEAIGMLGNLLVLWLIWRESKEAKMVGERQPFDAWHKAVFQ